ncbi:cation channel sperm-associated protein 4 [Varanus komodoensis]|uniref:cation channel sperm-associated protein 4 n=1 Tax=Varanus komodoensis TaxID=61221 RepID=UPI001CF7BBF0|nr:cation channel sperm-associated protein 4 [Varanus komodoensis]
MVIAVQEHLGGTRLWKSHQWCSRGENLDFCDVTLKGFSKVHVLYSARQVQETAGRLPSGEQEIVEINCKDITRIQDDWDVEEFLSKTCMGIFLHHPAFKILLASFIIINAITIAVRTDPTLEEKYFGLFSVIDTIVLAFLICEVLLNWYYGFMLYWKDGWNFINFFIVLFLFAGLIIPALNNKTLFYMLRVMRLVQVCTLVSGLARMIQVILQSIPDMANIMILLFAIMLVFSVFGVTLFGSLVPKHFGNLGTALYSLFICITQDGWVSIYDDFENEGLALQIGGALYFFIFITFGAFIFANLLVAVVTTNLEQSVAAYKEEKHLQAHDPSTAAYIGLDDGTDDDYPTGVPEPVHLKEVMHGTPMTHHQELLSFGNLGNLNDATCEDLCVVLEAIHENLKEYRVIRDELDQIVQEVRSIRFNIEQEQEIVLRNIRGANISETMLPSDIIQGKTDVLTALMNLEKSNAIDAEYQKGAVKQAALRARRQSLTPGGLLDKSHKRRESSPGGPAEKTQKHRESMSGGPPPSQPHKRRESTLGGPIHLSQKRKESLASFLTTSSYRREEIASKSLRTHEVVKQDRSSRRPFIAWLLGARGCRGRRNPFPPDPRTQHGASAAIMSFNADSSSVAAAQRSRRRNLDENPPLAALSESTKACEEDHSWVNIYMAPPTPRDGRAR